MSTSTAPTAAAYGVADRSISAALVEDGYAVVALLEATELEALRSVRDRHGTAPGDPRNGLFNDTWATDVNWKRSVTSELSALLASPVRRVLPDHRSLGFVHIVKWPGVDGAVVAHRDPTFVDECQFRSVMLWCALDDVDVTSGALWVVPRSHHDVQSVRVHQSASNVVSGVTAQCDGPATAVPVPAGHAVVYDHALVHLSGANTGPVERVVVAGPMVPAAATARYAVPVSSHEAHIVEIDPDFFVDHRLCSLDVDAVIGSYAHIETTPIVDV